MKINHNNTKELIRDCLTTLREQAIAANTYREKRIAIESDQRLAQDYQQKQIDELRDAYFYMYDQTKEKLLDRLEKIEAAELKNEAILEYDIPEYANTLNTIVAAKAKLHPLVLKTILENFAGHHQVLCSLESVYERFGEKTDDFFPYTVGITFKKNKIAFLIGNIERSEFSIVLDLNKIYSCFIELGKCLGISFPDEERQFSAIGGAVEDALVRAAMGLSDDGENPTRDSNGHKGLKHKS